MEATSAACGLQLKSRTIVAVHDATDGSSSKHRFIVGTASPEDNNQLHVLEYDEDTNEIMDMIAYSHPPEIVSLTTAHSRKDLVFSTHMDSKDYSINTATLSRMTTQKAPIIDTPAPSTPQSYAYDLRSALTTKCVLNPLITLPRVSFAPISTSELTSQDVNDASSVVDILWTSVESSPLSKVVSLHQGGVALWDLDASIITPPTDAPSTSTTAPSSDSPLPIPVGDSKVPCLKAPVRQSKATLGAPITCGVWDPHRDGSAFVTANGKSLRVWDTSSMDMTMMIACAHDDVINSIDFSPNRPFHLCTGGADGMVKVWDLRKPQRPVLLLHNHSHWVTSVKYNPLHDQLLLSAGADRSVCFWNALSVSSVPVVSAASSALAPSSHTDSKDQNPDRLIKRYTDHEDSVYSVAWSGTHAWVFASLSFDGRVVVNHVPANEKYRILL